MIPHSLEASVLCTFPPQTGHLVGMVRFTSSPWFTHPLISARMFPTLLVMFTFVARERFVNAIPCYDCTEERH
jgi:hypothetical protein